MKRVNYPAWSDLTDEQRASFGNGCGFGWMPKTLMFGWFFAASCRHHDFGYTVGGNEFRRWVCDWGFSKQCIVMLHG